MANKVKDTDYLYISTRLKALEMSMLTAERLNSMVNASSDAEAVKVLTEKGWDEFDPSDIRALEEQIDKRRNEVFELLYKYAPDRRIIDIFRLKYDYHNIKTYVKSSVLGTDESVLYSEAGTVPKARLEEYLDSGEHIDSMMKQGFEQAKKTLLETQDPQLSDMVLDRAQAAQMRALASASGSSFLQGYVRLYIDACNLRIYVRSCRLNKGGDEAYLLRALLFGGSIPAESVANPSLTPQQVLSLFTKGGLKEAAEQAQAALSGGTLAAFDKACDNALIEYMRQSRSITFGEAQVISYLYAREAELTSVRTIMICRQAGLEPALISEKLRCSYV